MHFFAFDAYDNPMQLSKVGNWVITFLSPKDQESQIQLAITNLLPRQISAHLQPTRTENSPAFTNIVFSASRATE